MAVGPVYCFGTVLDQAILAIYMAYADLIGSYSFKKAL